MKYKENLEITNVCNGVENSLVAIKDKDYNDFVYISIQANKHITKNPKIALVASIVSYNKFLTNIKKELKGHHTPELRQVASLTCTSFCEILRIMKVNNDTFDVMMYYNYKRPFSMVCKDYVSLTAVDLEEFIGGLN